MEFTAAKNDIIVDLKNLIKKEVFSPLIARLEKLEWKLDNVEKTHANKRL